MQIFRNYKWVSVELFRNPHHIADRAIIRHKFSLDGQPFSTVRQAELKDYRPTIRQAFSVPEVF